MLQPIYPPSVLEPATAVSTRASLRDLLPWVEGGLGMYIEGTGKELSWLDPVQLLGHHPDRRVIDLPARPTVAIPFEAPVDPTETFVQQAVRPVLRNGQVVGQVSARGVRQLLADAAPRSERERLSGLGHDMNNALAAVWGLAQEIEGPAKPGLLAAVDHLRGLVGQLGSGEAKGSEPTYVEHALPQLELWLRELARPGRLRVEADGPLPVTRVPRAVVERALANLVINAAEAWPGGTITVEAGSDRGALRLRVLDEGPGIPTEVKARLFEPGYSTKGSPGRGLGLASVKALLEGHGANIRVFSRPRGTGFEIRLGRAESRVHGAERQGMAPSPPLGES